MVNEKALQAQTQTGTNDSSGASNSISRFRIFEPPANMPVEHLSAWLSWLHQTTGEWWMPPSSYLAQDGSYSTSIAASTPRPMSGPLQPHSGPTPPAEPAPPPVAGAGAGQSNLANEEVTYQMPFPTMLPYYAVAIEQKQEGKRRQHILPAPRYNYKNSPYYEEATRLIELTGRTDLSAAVRLTLALVIAWCCSPLFRGMSGRDGRWFTISRDRAARELGIQRKHFDECVTMLQNAGLIKVGQMGKTGLELISRKQFEELKFDVAHLETDVGGGYQGFWRPRSIQEKNWIYLLQVSPSPSLPTFNPFKEVRPTSDGRETELKEENFGQTDVRPTSDGRLAGKEGSDGRETDFIASPTSVPVSSGGACINGLNVNDVHDDAPVSVSNNKKKKSQTAIPDLLQDLTPQQKEKFDYLTTATFDDYISPEGKSSLDPDGAFLLAFREDIPLSEMELRHEQVAKRYARYQAGLGEECNPLALFRWAIDNRKDVSGMSNKELIKRFTDRAARRAAEVERKRVQAEQGGVKRNYDAGTSSYNNLNRRGGNSVAGNGANPAAEGAANPNPKKPYNPFR